MSWDVRVWCENCDWTYEVEKPTEDSADMAAAAKSAAHVSTGDCPYGSTESEVTKNGVEEE